MEILQDTQNYRQLEDPLLLHTSYQYYVMVTERMHSQVNLPRLPGVIHQYPSIHFLPDLVVSTDNQWLHLIRSLCMGLHIMVEHRHPHLSRSHDSSSSNRWLWSTVDPPMRSYIINRRRLPGR